MPDPNPTPDATPVPAAEASIHAEPVDQLAGLSEGDLATWKSTGALPTASPVTTPTAAPSAATPGTRPAASTDASPQPAGSDPAAPTRGNADTRIPELLADRARERDRAERAERRLADLERGGPPAAPDARPAAPSAAPTELKRPDAETYPYGTSDPDYLEALTDWKVATRLAAERATYEQGQREHRARVEGERVITAFETKAAAARAKHPDFDAVAMLAPTEIPPGSAVDLWILEDPSGGEILYHLQQPANAPERRRLLSLSPREQLAELVRLGDRLMADPATSTTNAPPPATTLSTRAAPADATARALAMDGDEGTGAYIRAENAKDLARRLQR